jgi:coproporphyrinogen III oxidase-like Fe-S oxidoreductase
MFGPRIRSRYDSRARIPLKPVELNDFRDFLKTKPKNDPDSSVMYIHIPFCSRLCDFCAYTKIIGEESIIKLYVQKIKQHIKQLSNYAQFKEKVYSAVYFGGGSPCYINTQYIREIIEVIQDHFNLQNDCEITAELTVEDIQAEKLDQLHRSGINRISVGIQSFNTKARQLLGRIHTQEDILERAELLKESAFETICTDLIYHPELQNKSEWKDDLSYIKSLGFSGFSLYPLILFPNSKLSQNGVFSEADIQVEYDYYRMADNYILNLSGWDSITPHQYGLFDENTSEYILKVAEQSDILAFGCGSGGRIENYQYVITNDVNAFIQNPDNSFFADMSCFSVSKKYYNVSNLLLLPEALKIGIQESKQFPDKLRYNFDYLKSKSLIDETEKNYYLTQIGRFWAGNIADYLRSEIIKLFS